MDGATLETIDAKLDTLAELRTGLWPRFLSVDVAAQYTCLSVESVRRMIASGSLTPLRPVRGRVLIDRQQLDSVILSSTTTPRNGRGKR